MSNLENYIDIYIKNIKFNIMDYVRFLNGKGWSLENDKGSSVLVEDPLGEDDWVFDCKDIHFTLESIKKRSLENKSIGFNLFHKAVEVTFIITDKDKLHISLGNCAVSLNENASQYERITNASWYFDKLISPIVLKDLKLFGGYTIVQEWF